jgi:hypothetical protein
MGETRTCMEENESCIHKFGWKTWEEEAILTLEWVKRREEIEKVGGMVVKYITCKGKVVQNISQLWRFPYITRLTFR